MKSYKQYCGVAAALDVVGGRWSLLIVRDLLPGPRRYSELHRGLPGITTNMLADRLKFLRDKGVIEETTRDDGARAWELTPRGRSLESVVLGLDAFGETTLRSPEGHHTSPRWFAVSLQRRYRGGVRTSTGVLVIDGEPYTLRIRPAELRTRDGAAEHPDFVIDGSLPEVAAALARGQDINTTLLKIEGDTRIIEALQRTTTPRSTEPG